MLNILRFTYIQYRRREFDTLIISIRKYYIMFPILKILAYIRMMIS